jgi:hypothetical protein
VSGPSASKAFSWSVAGFAAAALTGAAIFAVSAVVLWWQVPSSPAADGSTPDRRQRRARSWRQALAHRRYVCFCVAYSSYLLSYNQLYVALPVELDRVGASDLTLAALFGAASLLAMVGQLPISAVTRRLPVRVVLPTGFSVLAMAFAVVAIAAPRSPAAGVAAAAPAALMVAMLTLGQMIVVPVALTLVPDFAGGAGLGRSIGHFTQKRNFSNDNLSTAGPLEPQPRTQHSSSHRSRSLQHRAAHRMLLQPQRSRLHINRPDGRERGGRLRRRPDPAGDAATTAVRSDPVQR